MNELCAICNGACCRGVSIPLSAEPQGDVRRWMETRGAVVGATWHIDSVCKHLHMGRCSIYDVRPQNCRDYEPGCDACKAARVVWGVHYEWGSK